MENYILFSLWYVYIDFQKCVCVCVMCACGNMKASICVRKSEDNSMELVLSFNFSMGAGAHTQVARLVGQPNTKLWRLCNRKNMYGLT